MFPMAKKTTKKAVIFIVEGKSDKKALEHIFQIIYKHKKPNIEVKISIYRLQFDVAFQTEV